MKKIILILIFGLCIFIFGLQFFINKGLKPLIQEKVLPVIKERIKSDVSIGNISLNLFAGKLSVENIKVSNPSGFEERELLSVKKSIQDISIKEIILKRLISVQEITIKDSVINVIRNSNGVLNLDKITEQLRASEQKPDRQDKQTEQIKENCIPPFKLQNFFINSGFLYSDSYYTKEKFELNLDTSVTAKNISNQGRDELSGQFNIKGNLKGKTEIFVMEIGGRIAPLNNILKPTFEVSGNICSIDLSLFKDICKETKIKSGIITLKIELKCLIGVYDAGKSVISGVVNKLEFEDGVITDDVDLSSLNFTVPVKGLFDKPEFNFQTAFINMIIENVIKKQGLKLLQKTGRDFFKKEGVDQQKVDKEIKRVLGDSDLSRELTKKLSESGLFDSVDKKSENKNLADEKQ